MSVRSRHAYFDDDGSIHAVSQARFERLVLRDGREAFPSLAGRRVRFLTLYVRLEDGVAKGPIRVEGSWIAFDDAGHRDRTEADRERRATVNLLDPPQRSDEDSTVVLAAARFETARFRWIPTPEDIEAAIRLHRLRRE